MRRTTRNPENAGYATPEAQWTRWPAAQQPHWRHHPAYERSAQAVASASPLVSLTEVTALRRALATVAAGGAQVLQVGDCAESLYECTPRHTAAKLETLHRLADHLERRTGAPVIRVGRMGGQFAKPRSRPVERHGDIELPVFRGHMVNSEVPTRAAREHDPRRMLSAYAASAAVLGEVRKDRERRQRRWPRVPGEGPWSSHEALVVDYESRMLTLDAETGMTFLGSTHLPWIGDRTRQPDSAHVRLLASVMNPVACKLGPTASASDVLQLCELLDPHREAGRLLLIARMGKDRVGDVLPPILTAVQRAGYRVVWLCDPMHGNTVRGPAGLKTRYLSDLVQEVTAFARVLARAGEPAGGLHLEVAATHITECVGAGVADDERLVSRYRSLCDPRLNPRQAIEVLNAFG